MSITRRTALAGLAGTVAAPAYIGRAYANPMPASAARRWS